MWLLVPSLSLHNIHLLFCWVVNIFALTKSLWRDSVLLSEIIIIIMINNNDNNNYYYYYYYLIPCKFFTPVKSSKFSTSLFAFHKALITLKKLCIQLFSQQLWVKSRHHHHHVMLPAQISLTLSRHTSLPFIASGRSSGLHPVSSQSWCKYVRAGRPAFARPYVGVHRSTSLMSSSLLLQQCPACLVRLTWIVFVMEGKWPYSWCLVGCCLHDLFNIARSIFV